MSSEAFVHLRVASGWSMRHGASSPQALVARAAELGQPALALTDRDGVYGAVKFVLACGQAGISPILGVDLAVAGEVEGLRGAGRPRAVAASRTPVRGGAAVDPRLPRITVLARGREGWAALCRIVTAAHTGVERGHPALPWPVLAELLCVHAGGGSDTPFVVLLGPDSALGGAIMRRRLDLARGLLNRWREVVPSDALRIELVSPRGDDRDPRGVVRSTSLAARMLQVAVDERIAPVLTNAVRYARPEQARVVDVLDAVRRLVPLDERHLDRVNAQGHLASMEHMTAIAHEIAERAAVGGTARVAERLLEVTRETADQCVIDPQEHLGLGRAHLPEPDPRDRRPVDLVLRQRCEAGLVRRRLHRAGEERSVRDRLEGELAVIEQLGFASYFLTVADIVDLIRGMGIRVAARGSGAGSLVNHLLEVSGVDPVAHDLLFERFLSPLRAELPDIDLDVESARRPEIYERIIERYGAERVACVSMTDTYRVRHAIRDVGAALGMNPAEIGAFAKAFPHIRARDVRAALRELPELRGGSFAKGAERMGLMLDLVEELDALPRHVALHPCGIVLSNLSLLDRTPVESSAAGFPMSQFDKDDVEHMGLLKLDVLGIRMQSAMAYAVEEVRRVDGLDIDLDDRVQVPLDDEPTYELIRSTRTLGCFQIESPGQRELLGKFAPEVFGDLVIDISLFRPGPVKSDMIMPFLRARQGWSEAVYLHEDLRPILEQTFGVVVFHEQVLRIVSLFTGESLARADEVRRALGDVERHEQLRAWFYSAALDQGYGLEVVEQVWEVLRAFGSFGFCKAHAAAFALPTYQSAWLKTHHPAAFLAGVLTHDPGMYPKRLILDDVRQLGIAVLPLDVDRSEGVYRIERIEGERVDESQLEASTPGSAGEGGSVARYGIRLSLADVKGISDDEVKRIVESRPYLDLADFCSRVRAARPVVERLVVAGGFDALYGIAASTRGRSSGRRGRITRRDLLLQIADLNRASSRAKRSKAGAGQLSLLGGTTRVGEPDRSSAGQGLPEMTDAERVRAELEVLGLDASRHVIDFYRGLLERLGVTRSRDLLRTRSGSEVLVAGVKVATQTPPVRSGRRVVFLTLDDSTGPVDLAFFDDVQGETTSTVFGGWLLLARGVLRRSGPKGVSIRATGAWDLAALYAMFEQHGAAAVLDLLAATPRPGERGTSDGAPPQHRRVLVHPSGYQQSPYADLKPQGTDPSDTRRALPASPTSEPPRKLWHTSPGSPGDGR